MNKNAKKTVRSFVIAFIVTLLFSYFFQIIFLKAEELDVENKKYYDIVETEFEGIRLLTFEKSEELYTIKFEIPVFESGMLNNYFKKYMNHTKKEFLAMIQDHVSKERPGSLYATLDIIPSGNMLYSLVSSIETYTGGANVNQQKKVWIVDLTTNQLVAQGDLFKNIQTAREVLMPKVEQALLEDPDLESAILEDELEEWVNQPHYNFENMFIREGKLVFKFDKYEVAAGAAGMPEIEIPIDDEVAKLFKDVWLNRIQN